MYKESKQRKQNLTVSIDARLHDLLRDYQNDTFNKSRSLAVQSILAEYFFEQGYIDRITYADLLGILPEREGE